MVSTSRPRVVSSKDAKGGPHLSLASIEPYYLFVRMKGSAKVVRAGDVSFEVGDDWRQIKEDLPRIGPLGIYHPSFPGFSGPFWHGVLVLNEQIIIGSVIRYERWADAVGFVPTAVADRYRMLLSADKSSRYEPF